MKDETAAIETPHDPETGEVLPEPNATEKPATLTGYFETIGDPETLRGDLCDAILNNLKALTKPWPQMSQREQEDVIQACKGLAGGLVRSAVRVVSDFGFPSCAAVLGEIKIIGGDKSRIEGKLVAHNVSEIRDVLGEHVNSHIMIVCVDSETFHGSKAEPKSDPDQPDLPMGEDDKPIMDGSASGGTAGSEAA